MARSTQRRLVVPGFLAAFAIGAAPSCGGEGGPHGSVSGEDECYDIPDMETCEAETAFLCRWEAASSSCYPDCESYTEASECNDDDSCEWIGSSCGLNQS